MPNISLCPVFIAKALAADIGEVFPLGSEAVAVIGRLKPDAGHQNFAGNMQSELCWHEGRNCQDICRSSVLELGDYTEKYCARRNLLEALHALGIDLKRFLLVRVSANQVGFADTLQPERSIFGYHGATGFNAFFARTSEWPALGALLADCACLVISLQDDQGAAVTGILHGTRINLRGPSQYVFAGPDGMKVSWVHHALLRGLQHYHAEPASVRLRLIATIRPEHYGYNFENREAMDKLFPGLYAAGYIHKIAGMPDWQDKHVPEQSWRIDVRHCIQDNITEAMDALRIPRGNFTAVGQIDPADENGGYSSHHRAVRLGLPDTRDLYIVYTAAAIS